MNLPTIILLFFIGYLLVSYWRLDYKVNRLYDKKVKPKSKKSKRK